MLLLRICEECITKLLIEFEIVHIVASRVSPYPQAKSKMFDSSPNHFFGGIFKSDFPPQTPFVKNNFLLDLIIANLDEKARQNWTLGIPLWLEEILIFHV